MFFALVFSCVANLVFFRVKPFSVLVFHDLIKQYKSGDFTHGLVSGVGMKTEKTFMMLQILYVIGNY